MSVNNVPDNKVQMTNTGMRVKNGPANKMQMTKGLGGISIHRKKKIKIKDVGKNGKESSKKNVNVKNKK